MPDNLEIVNIADLPPVVDPAMEMYATITNPVDGKTFKVPYSKIKTLLGVDELEGGIGSASTTTVPTAGINTYSVDGGAGTYVNFLTAAATPAAFTAPEISSGLWQLVKVQGATYWTRKQLPAVDISGKQDLTTASMLNLFPNANKGLELTSQRAAFAADGIPVFFTNPTTPTFSIVSDFQGFTRALKINTKAGDRAILASGIIDLAGFIIGTTLKLNAGVFIKVPGTYNGIINLSVQKPDLSIQIGQNSNEFVQLENNWRYYRFTSGQVASFSGGQCIFYLQLDNRLGTVNTDFYVAAPAVLRTDSKIAPAAYTGIDNPKFLDYKLYETQCNRVFDSEFIKQIVGAAPTGKWTIAAGGATAFIAPAVVVAVDTPIGTTALEVSHQKRSSDNFTTDLQLLQTITIPGKYQKKTVWSFGYFLKRESVDISPADLSVTYYSDDAGTVVLTTNTKVFVVENETVGSWAFVKAENVPLPAGAKSLRFIGARTRYVGTTLDTVKKAWVCGLTARFDTGSMFYPSGNQDEKIQELLPDISGFLQNPDLYEANNNPFFDPLLIRQNIGSGAVTPPYSMETGNPAIVFAGAYDVVSLDNPVGNRALQISTTRRSSDTKYTDNQFKQLLQIPLHLQGKTLSSFGYWMKRENIAKTNILYLVQFYSDTAGTVQLGANLSGNATIVGETVNQWVFVKTENLTIPAGAKSARFTPRIQWNPADTTTLDTVYKVWITGFVANLAGGTIKGYTRSGSDPILNTLYSKLVGKKWTSYGDSITAAGEYQKPVISKFGLIHALRGIGGTSIHETGTIAWVDNNGFYLDRPPASQPPGSTQILSSMCNQERINTIPLDTDIITIMGGTNDPNVTMGTINDTDTSTFYGAYNTMLQRIYTRIPNAEMILCTPIHRTDDVATNMEAVRVAIRALAAKYKLRLIDMAKCGINQFNVLTWLADGIHPTVPAGYERMSRVFLETFPSVYA